PPMRWLARRPPQQGLRAATAAQNCPPPLASPPPARMRSSNRFVSNAPHGRPAARALSLSTSAPPRRSFEPALPPLVLRCGRAGFFGWIPHADDGAVAPGTNAF